MRLPQPRCDARTRSTAAQESGRAGATLGPARTWLTSSLMGVQTGLHPPCPRPGTRGSGGGSLPPPHDASAVPATVFQERREAGQHPGVLRKPLVPTRVEVGDISSPPLGSTSSSTSVKAPPSPPPLSARPQDAEAVWGKGGGHPRVGREVCAVGLQWTFCARGDFRFSNLHFFGIFFGGVVFFF